MSDYFEEVRRGMALLAADERTVFVGQSMKWDGNAQYRTLQWADGTPIVPADRRIEMPVEEEFQAGFCLGLALEGYLPVCIYPRMDFLILACNQIVNHIDKLAYTSFAAKLEHRVIIRTAVGAKYPYHSGHQHTQDHTSALRLMLKTVEVIELASKFDVMPGYRRAAQAYHSCLIVERSDLYNA